MDRPTVITYTSAPVAALTTGRIGEPAYVDIPKGVVAYVQLYASIMVEAYMFMPPFLPSLGFEAELTGADGSSPGPLSLMPKGRILIAPGAERPAAVAMPPAGKRLNWWPYVEDITAMTNPIYGETPLIQVWLRALLVDEATPPAQLAHLAASLL